MRRPLSLLACVALAVAGCLSEARRVEAPPEPAEPEARIRLKLVHVAAPMTRSGKAEALRGLEQAVSHATQEQGLDAVVFGGDVVANEDPRETPAALDGFAAVAGIVAAKRFVVLGERERAGILPRADVVRALEKKKLVLDRSGTYHELVKPGVRLFALDVGQAGEVTEDAAKAVRDAIAAAKEPFLIVAADRPPLDEGLMGSLRKETRVKLLLFRGEAGTLEVEPGGMVSLATPSLGEGDVRRYRMISVDGGDLRTWLVELPAGKDAVIADDTNVRLRPRPPGPAPVPPPDPPK